MHLYFICFIYKLNKIHIYQILLVNKYYYLFWYVNFVKYIYLKKYLIKSMHNFLAQSKNTIQIPEPAVENVIPDVSTKLLSVKRKTDNNLDTSSSKNNLNISPDSLQIMGDNAKNISYIELNDKESYKQVPKLKENSKNQRNKESTYYKFEEPNFSNSTELQNLNTKDQIYRQPSQDFLYHIENSILFEDAHSTKFFSSYNTMIGLEIFLSLVFIILALSDIIFYVFNITNMFYICAKVPWLMYIGTIIDFLVLAMLLIYLILNRKLRNSRKFKITTSLLLIMFVFFYLLNLYKKHNLAFYIIYNIYESESAIFDVNFILPSIENN